MARSAAFVILVCAAFAWVPPFLDRAGMAALGLAFLAYALPPRPTKRLGLRGRIAPPVILSEPDKIDPLTPEMTSQLERTLARLDGRDPVPTPPLRLHDDES